MTDGESGRTFRLAYVPGVTPAKWVNVWTERMPDVPLTLVAVPAADVVGLLRDGGADAGFVRLPVDRDGLSVIPLYVETTVVVVPKDHAVAAADEVTVDDLADDEVFHPLDDTIEWTDRPGTPAFTRPATTADAVQLVASGAGLLLVPQSLARLHHRKDLTYRPMTDAPQSQVALAWPTDATTDLVEDFIGIVRGRTVNSSRGRTPPPASAAEKTGQRKPPKPAQNGSGRRAATSGRGVPSNRRRKGNRPR
ncbi:LysR family substrate-binding domain-containing protein [Nonomuraea sp. SMC257]|uniref:LysR family substrate-binding domain-containing protein n=1 Tax=Nonomuraea montanisoli TaxID=2741721 RepID=A0A7Y6I3F1_9ACTN|nr:LysR family substrate-binding domain-containing protein [Nonomuraea montanisoli]NUW30756.1 LysR family substrate-binding domain-containing protein [Nonomuraea montanisoli]